MAVIIDMDMPRGCIMYNDKTHWTTYCPLYTSCSRRYEEEIDEDGFSYGKSENRNIRPKDCTLKSTDKMIAEIENCSETYVAGWDGKRSKTTKEMKQEPVLNKIRAEIEQRFGAHGNISLYNKAIHDVLMILDKYKAESENP